MLLVLMLTLAATMAFAAGEEEASAPAAMAADGEPVLRRHLHHERRAPATSRAAPIPRTRTAAARGTPR